MFFCRATNALISVRLDYNNLRKKYRNFWFLFCSFGLLFYSSFSPSLRFLHLLSRYFSFFLFLSLFLSIFFLSFSFSHFLSLARSYSHSLSLSLYLFLTETRSLWTISPKRIAKICCAENGIIVRHIQIILLEVKVIGGLFIILFFSLSYRWRHSEKKRRTAAVAPMWMQPFRSFPPFPISLPPRNTSP